MVPRWSFFLSKKGVENLATLSFKKLLNLFIKCSCGPIRGLFLNCSFGPNRRLFQLKEKKRIQEAGGFVSMNGVWRVQVRHITWPHHLWLFHSCTTKLTSRHLWSPHSACVRSSHADRVHLTFTHHTWHLPSECDLYSPVPILSSYLEKVSENHML